MTLKRWVVAFACVVGWVLPAAAQCVSALIPVSQPVVFPNRSAGPVAFTGSSFGVAKQDADQLANAIWFAMYDANLNQAGADRLLAPRSLDGPRRLLWNGSEFGLFYFTPESQITLQRIDAGGNPIGGPVAVAPNHPQFGGQDFDVAWDPSRKVYVVLRTNTVGFDRGLWLTTVAADGTTKTDDLLTFLIAATPQPRLAVTSSGTIGIVWSRVVNDQQELAFAVTAPGQVPASITTIAHNASNAQIATDDRAFLVVYSATVTGGATVLRSAKFDSAGRTITPDAVLVSGAQDEVAFSLVANQTLGEWGLLYVSYPFGALSTFGGETRLRRIPFNAAVPQSDTVFSADLTKTALLPQSALVWTGSSYVASIGRVISRAEGTESYLARVCPLVVTAQASTKAVLPNVPVTFTAQASGGNPDYTYSWTFGDISPTAPGQTVSHAYPFLGTYTATVTATDRNGSVATATVVVTVANLKRRAAGK